MLNEFTNIKELIQYFDDERICYDYLEKKRWKGTITCLYCFCEKVYKYSNERLYRCSSCTKTFTITKGTIFERSKIPLSTWFAVIYFYTSHKTGVSSVQISKHFGLTQRTAWSMHQKIMETFAVDIEEIPNEHGMWEVDEVYIGPTQSRLSHKRRKQVQKVFGSKYQTAILAFYKRNSKDSKDKLFGTIIPNNSNKDFIQPILKRYIDSMSVLVTDGSALYKDLGKYFLYHEVLNHSKKQYASGIYHSNTIEGSFRHFKDGIRGTYKQLTKKHLKRYWDEFCFKYNTRTLSDIERFDLTFDTINRPITYKEIVHGKKSKESFNGQTTIQSQEARQTSEDQPFF